MGFSFFHVTASVASQRARVVGVGTPFFVPFLKGNLQEHRNPCWVSRKTTHPNRGAQEMAVSVQWN